MMMRLGRLMILLGMSLSLESYAEAMWSTSVHSYFLDRAFPNESLKCRTQMKLGSIMADSFDFQGEDFVHMHAMRTADQTPEQAEKRMWKFIRDKYADVRLLHKKTKYPKFLPRLDLNIQSCYLRGMALHPVMDATSPAHAGFKVWDVTEVTTALFDHGDIREYLDDKLGVSFGVPHSHEDREALKKMPQIEQGTTLIMRRVDALLREKDVEGIKIRLYKKGELL